MNEQADMKELISRYVDDQVTDEERKIVEKYLKTDQLSKQYYEQLKGLSATLKEWKDENISPDLEQKIKKALGKETVLRKSPSSLSRVNVGMGALVAILLVVIIGQFWAKTSSRTQLAKGEKQALLRSIDLASAPKDGIKAIPKEKSSEKISQLTDFSDKRDKFPDDIGALALNLRNESGLDIQLLDSGISKQPTRNDSQIAKFLKTKQLKSETKKEDVVTYQLMSSGTPINVEFEYWGGGTSTQTLAKVATPRTEAARQRRRTSGFQKSNYEPYYLGGDLQHAPYSKNGEDYGMYRHYPQRQQSNTEAYDRIYENPFLEVTENPLSTLSIDVDTASYSNIRRFLNSNQMPPKDSVRIEEMINYFSYDYPYPTNQDPFSITTKVSLAPWNPEHHLVLIGLQGKVFESAEVPPSNLVFLIDVSGSMKQPNKLPLLKSSFQLLVNQLRENEKVAIVVYAGAAGVVLESTPGSDKQRIRAAINQLNAGGSTAGGAGLKLAYKIAKENFIKNGNNRVILATDGDFNVGVSSDSEMVRLIEDNRDDGVFLTILGFGTGNYKDSKMEKIADHGNGNYYYIDTLNEAKKVLVHELGSTLFTIAKDVKIQIEFNPNRVKAYRLIGYENRILAKEDFNDDTKDAGELGAGHSVTALYELIPADSEEEFRQVDELVYQKKKILPSNDLMTVKLRYKKPDGNKSKLITKTIKTQDMTESPRNDFQFAAAVAEFGLLLRNSAFKAHASYAHVIKNAKESTGKDVHGYREEFIKLVEAAQTLDTTTPGEIQFKGQ